jgi:hypothetical protein
MYATAAKNRLDLGAFCDGGASAIGIVLEPERSNVPGRGAEFPSLDKKALVPDTP